MDNEARMPIKPIKSLLYWRQSKINGAATVPVVLTLDQSGVLTMKTADQETEFSLPANEAAVRFTSWGTMVIGVQGNSYDIVGLGASLSPKPSKAQLEELGAPSGNNPRAGTDLNRVLVPPVLPSALPAISEQLQAWLEVSQSNMPTTRALKQSKHGRKHSLKPVQASLKAR
jgi:hypothetical protein